MKTLVVLDEAAEIANSVEGTGSPSRKKGGKTSKKGGQIVH